MAAIPNTNYYETGPVNPEWDPEDRVDRWAGEYEGGLDAVDDEGTVPVSDGPGPGVEPDRSLVEDRAVDRQVYR